MNVPLPLCWRLCAVSDCMGQSDGKSMMRIIQKRIRDSGGAAIDPGAY